MTISKLVFLVASSISAMLRSGFAWFSCSMQLKLQLDTISGNLQFHLRLCSSYVFLVPSSEPLLAVFTLKARRPSGVGKNFSCLYKCKYQHKTEYNDKSGQTIYLVRLERRTNID